MASSNLRPYYFLIASLAISEAFLIIWMVIVARTIDTERIVVGSLSIAILIAVLVVYCVVYWIKMNSEIEDNKMKHDLGDHGIGTTLEREAITEWPARLLYYDTVSQSWYYNSHGEASDGVDWTEVKYDKT